MTTFYPYCREVNIGVDNSRRVYLVVNSGISCRDVILFETKRIKLIGLLLGLLKEKVIPDSILRRSKTFQIEIS